MKPSHGKRTREAIGGTLQKVLKVLHQIKGIPQNEMLYEINQALGEGESELNKGQLSRWIAGETIPETAQAIEVLPVVLGRWGNLLMPDDFDRSKRCTVLGAGTSVFLIETDKGLAHVRPKGKMVELWTLTSAITLSD